MNIFLRILFVICFVLASYSVFSQSSTVPSYIGVKCPKCVVQTWDFYSFDGKVESISSPTDFINIDWANMTVDRWGFVVQKITGYEISAIVPIAKIWYGDRLLTIFYGNSGRKYSGHIERQIEPLLNQN